MTKEEERKKIIEAIIQDPLTADEVKENLKKAGFIFKQPAEENKSKKKANL